MAAWTLKFDSSLFELFHWHRPARAAATRAGGPVSREVGQRRAEAMRSLFPKLSAWYARRSYLAQMGAVDRYLSQATDLVDLEHRIREIERNSGQSHWY